MRHALLGQDQDWKQHRFSTHTRCIVVVAIASRLKILVDKVYVSSERIVKKYLCLAQCPAST